MKIQKVSINGQIYQPEAAAISALDQGLTAGVGLFESFRVSTGRIFLYDQHIARLQKSAEVLGIDTKAHQNKFRKWIDELAADIPTAQDGFIRLVLTAGINNSPQTIIYLYHIDKFTKTEKPAEIIKDLTRQKPEYFAQTNFRMKTLDYVTAAIAKKRLNQKTEAILLSPEGYTCEALTANIFWTKNGKLYTPPLSLGILAGTVRAWTVENFAASEKLAKKDQLMEADEIFLTSGASYLLAINHLEDKPKPGLHGSLYEKIFSRLKQEIS